MSLEHPDEYARHLLRRSDMRGSDPMEGSFVDDLVSNVGVRDGDLDVVDDVPDLNESRLDVSFDDELLPE